jgi:hypothetical protein
MNQMARVLLIDREGRFEPHVIMKLRTHGHDVIPSSREEIGCNPLAILAAIDIVVVNITGNTEIDWDLLRNICQIASILNPGPQVLSISHVYRGPTMRLRAERLGSAFIYV